MPELSDTAREGWARLAAGAAPRAPASLRRDVFAEQLHSGRVFAFKEKLRRRTLQRRKARGLQAFVASAREWRRRGRAAALRQTLVDACELEGASMAQVHAQMLGAVDALVGVEFIDDAQLDRINAACTAHRGTCLARIAQRDRLVRDAILEFELDAVFVINTHLVAAQEQAARAHRPDLVARVNAKLAATAVAAATPGGSGYEAVDHFMRAAARPWAWAPAELPVAQFFVSAMAAGRALSRARP